VEYLPADPPDLNPVEGLWANLKGVELAAAAEQGIGRVRDQSTLPGVLPTPGRAFTVKIASFHEPL
jgi:hypothetical protein